MIPLLGYLDDSGSEADPNHSDLFCTLAGPVAPVGAFPDFEKDWEATLVQHGIPYLHMREIQRCNRPPYDIWKGRPDLVEAALLDFAHVMQRHGMACCGSVVRIPDLIRFNQRSGTSIGAYAMCIYTTMIEIGVKFPDAQVEILLDRVDRPFKKISQAVACIKSDTFYPNIASRISIKPIGRGQLARDIPALQAADFAAWEFRRSFSEKVEWFANHKTGDDPHEWDRSLREFDLKQFGLHPHRRLSLSALIGLVGIEGTLWDTRGLNIIDNARGGNWPRGETT